MKVQGKVIAAWAVVLSTGVACLAGDGKDEAKQAAGQKPTQIQADKKDSTAGTAPVEDVAFFEKKYQKKINGVKPKSEYSDPDEFYSAIGQQLGIPELAWKAAAEKYGWKKDDGRNTFTMLKGGPTSAGGEGTWDVMFIRSTINPETKKPDPASVEEVMVQIDYDGNIMMLERKVKDMRPFVRELEKKREVVK
jgi:hypothetical protein